MKKGINKAILVGRLSQDVEIRYMPSGGAVANINVVTNESWRDKSTGEEREKAEFHKVSIFGKLAEIAGQYLQKGSMVYIEGKMQTRKWQDQNGQDRYTTEVAVQPIGGVMQMLGGGQQGQQQNQGHAPAQPQQQGQQQQPAPQYDNVPDDFDESIPF